MIAALAVTGLLAGIGITAVGPGGVLATVGLFVFTSLSPAQVAGTAIVTHVATGVLGSAAFVHSGQLREPGTRRVAGMLAGVAVIGTPVGVLLNSWVSTKVFGVLLGGFAVIVAAFVGLRRKSSGTGVKPVVAALIGAAVAVVAGLVGVGGPMLAVPLLVVAGMPVLGALAAAQVQSVVIASVGTVGYLGSIDWRLAAIVGIPELAGVLLGWRLAHALPTRTLKAALVVVLLGIAPYLALHG